jgi:hypothetical protein
MLTIALSVLDLLTSFESYNALITKLGAKASSWQNYKFCFWNTSSKITVGIMFKCCFYWFL